MCIWVLYLRRAHTQAWPDDTHTFRAGATQCLDKTRGEVFCDVAASGKRVPCETMAVTLYDANSGAIRGQRTLR